MALQKREGERKEWRGNALKIARGDLFMLFLRCCRGDWKRQVKAMAFSNFKEPDISAAPLLEKTSHQRQDPASPCAQEGWHLPACDIISSTQQSLLSPALHPG